MARRYGRSSRRRRGYSRGYRRRSSRSRSYGMRRGRSRRNGRSSRQTVRIVLQQPGVAPLPGGSAAFANGVVAKVPHRGRF